MSSTAPRSRTGPVCRVLLADDQGIFRAGVARVLDAESDVCVMSQCDNAEQALELVAATRNCVLLIAQSLYTPAADRLLAAAALTASRIILIAEGMPGLPSGAVRRLDGILSRQTSAAELLACVRRVQRGERAVQLANGSPDAIGSQMRDMLSQREMQIIGFVVQGCKNRQIAELIGTTEQMVKNYLRSIYDKTGASDRLELALFALHHRALAAAVSSAAAQPPT